MIISLLKLSSFLFRIVVFHIDVILFMMQRCILLDIEGTITPRSFITDVLFPYSHANVGKHLAATFDSKETQVDINLLRSQVSFPWPHHLPSIFRSSFVLLSGSFTCNIVISLYKLCNSYQSHLV